MDCLSVDETHPKRFVKVHSTSIKRKSLFFGSIKMPLAFGNRGIRGRLGLLTECLNLFAGVPHFISGGELNIHQNREAVFLTVLGAPNIMTGIC